MIEIKQTKKMGRGLYASKNIRKGEIVEISPVIVVDEHTAPQIEVYLFEFGRDKSAIALGLGSLFNHSKKANITYNPVIQNKNIIFVALKNIKKNSQLFINYGYDPKIGVDKVEREQFNILKQKFEPNKIELLEYRKEEDKLKIEDYSELNETGGLYSIDNHLIRF